MKHIWKVMAICLVLIMCICAWSACGTSEDDPSDTPEDSTYEVVFKSGDGEVLKTEQVASGGAATAPEVPERVGYEFIGWDVAFDNITYPLTVTAQYNRLWLVTFTDGNGNALKTEYVRTGEAATAPEVTDVPAGYSFLGWDKSYDFITADTTVTRVLNETGKVTVVFKDYDGSVIDTSDVILGGAATAPTAPTHEGYTFVSWSRAYDCVTAHMDVIAVYRETDKYLVTFVDSDGTVHGYSNVASGEAATAPADPTRTGYKFTGWDKAYTNITADTVVTAEYTPKATYTVTFTAFNNAVLKTQTVMEGDSAIPPVAPARNGYIFVGWDKPYTNVTEDITVKVDYDLLRHSVTFDTQGGSEVLTQQIIDGRSATEPAGPTRDGFTFLEWQSNGEKFDFTTSIKGDITIYAAYETTTTAPKGTHATLVVNPDYLEMWSGMTLQMDIAPQSNTSGLNYEKNSGATFEFFSTVPSVVSVKNDGTITAHEVGVAQVWAVVKSGGSYGGHAVATNDVITAATIYVTEAPEYYQAYLEDGDNQKITLGSTTKSRIDKNKYLNYPTGGYGSANIALWYGDAQAAFTMTVDDNPFISNQSAQWEAWHQEYGIPVTYTAWSARLGSMNAESTLWKNLIAQGSAMQTHGADHIAIGENTTSARAWYDAYYGQKKMSTLTGQDIRTIGHPNGTNYPDVSSILFVAGRGVVGYPNDVTKVNYNATNCMSTFGYGAEKMMNDVFGGSYANGWICVLYHSLEGAESQIESSYEILSPYIADGRLWATTFSAAAMYGQERDTAEVNVNYADVNVVTFDVTDGMNDLLYSQALTIRIKVNSAWKNARASQGGVERACRIVEKGGETYLLVDAVPDRGEVTVVRTDIENVETSADAITFRPVDLVGTYNEMFMTYSFTVADEVKGAAATQSGLNLTTVVKTEGGVKRVYVTFAVNGGEVNIQLSNE